MLSLDLLCNALGLVGVGIVLVAYFLLQSGRMDVRSMGYSALNFVGALLILISVLWDWNLPAFIIEVAWIGISLYGMAKAWRSRG